ncbi:MAG: c-type cytochrome [Sphingobium sp.]
MPFKSTVMRRVTHLSAVTLLTLTGQAAMAGGDPAAGKKAFLQCQICHSVNPGGANGMGPNLAGVTGSKAALKPGFTYSAALKKSGIVWNAKTLDAWIAKPSALVPGNRMVYVGMADPAKRADVIAYLATLKAK